jgi:ethanolamine utilization protein EutN
MRLARVTGTVTGTMKEKSLVGQRLLIVDLVGPDGDIQDAGHVAADAVGAGVGDVVLVTTGSAARQAVSTMGIPVDLAVVVVVDEVVVGGRRTNPDQKGS